ALSAIEERYERWTYHRTKTQARRKSNGVKAAKSARDTDRIAGRCVFLPVRYADDFVVLVSGTQENAIAEKSALAEYLYRTMGLELSPEKTKVTAMTEGFEFLGFRFGMHWDKRYGYGPRVEIPKAKAANLRRKVKRLTKRNSVSVGLGDKLREINPILRGWANYYRYCVGAGRVFVNLDWYIGLRLYCWLRKKRPKAGVRELWGSKQPSSRRPTRR
ncbi:group II intron maturase-specific domain-containing protein, partial [Allomesorhizobium camelthorni]